MPTPLLRRVLLRSLAVATATGLPAAPAASQDYSPIVRGETVLAAPSGLLLRVLVDERTLEGTRVEMAELTFPGGAARGGVHRHGSDEILYVLSGRLDHEVNGRVHHLEPGMVGLVRAGDEVAHTVVSEEPVRVLAVWAPTGELGRILPLFTSQRAPIEGDGPVETAGSGLDALRDDWIRAYQAGDSAAMSAFYTEDAVRMPYDAPSQEGREAIVAAYRRSFRERTFQPEIELLPDDLTLRGGEAVERGRYREVLRPMAAGGRALIEEGKYVSLARLGADGSWRFELSMFNRDAPARPLGEGG